MFPAIIVVVIAICALNVSCGYSLPVPNSGDHKDGDDYIVMSNHPRKTVKVEVVDAKGNASIKEYEVLLDDSSAVTESSSKIDEKTTVTVPNTCDWKQLFRDYLDKRKLLGVKVTREKSKAVREAYQVVCQNPKKALQILLRYRTAEIP